MNQPIPDRQSQRQDNLIKDTTVVGNFIYNPQQIIEKQIIEISVEKVTQKSLIKASPYKGLKRFNSGDREYFFGRNALIAELFKAVHESSFVLVLGASGSGKSSAVRAGLIPELKKSLESQKFYDFIFTPNQDPLESLYRCLLNEEKDYRFSESAAKVALKARPDTLLQVISDLKRDEEQWFFFIDQFEQLFTICTDLEKRKNFIEGIVQVARKGESSVRIVLAMRSDFLEQFSFYPTLGAIANQNNIHLVTEMYTDELRQAIEQPAAKHGVVFEKGLVEQIIKEVEGQSGYLPLLQYTLNLLWERECEDLSSGGRSHIEDRTLNKTSYAALNGVRGALQKRIDEIYKDICNKNKDGELATKQIFLKLVNIVESDLGSRAVSRRAYRYEFVGEPVESILKRFIDENLLVSGYEYLSEELLIGESTKSIEHATIEIAHEILLSSWDKLKYWLEEEKKTIILKNWLAGETRRWLEVRAKDESTANDELLKGSRLEQVVKFREKNAFEKLGGLNQQENEFVDASIEWHSSQKKEKTHRQRLIRTTWGIIGCSAILMASTFIFWRQAEIAKIEPITQSAKSLLTSNKPFDALIPSLKAAKQLQRSFFPKTNVQTEVVNLLRQAISEVREQNRLVNHKERVNSISFSDDGKTLASASADKTVKLWDAATGRVIRTLKGHTNSVNSISFSDDGKTLASGSADKTIKLWDVATGRVIRTLKGHTDYVNSISFSDDGKTLASASADKTIKLWD
ncbi:NACHT and WD repeat domain-containing protein, partial [Nostoc commune]|uniref:NACHT and WD repeat domain-containing protein n=1 Tax=Nostoc commune TaxID=1178 RepID=UPI0018C82E3F